MANLTKKEIVDQLNKLGFHTTSEIHQYYAEYKAYSEEYSHAYFTRRLQKISKKLLLRRNATLSTSTKEKHLSRSKNNS